jgi:hypothetical protein
MRIKNWAKKRANIWRNEDQELERERTKYWRNENQELGKVEN